MTQASLEARLAQELRERLYPLLQQQWVMDAFQPRVLAYVAHGTVLDYFRLGGKRCSACHKTRERADFGPNAAKRDGLQNVCRECRRQRRKG